MSFENLWLVNGVVINENLRGQPLNLFIEDAIEETQVLTSGISSEYGRFSGGVVNAVTKRGGNDLFELRNFKRLQEVIESAQFHGFDCLL